MTQENKELLLKDLTARLPYGVIVQQSPKYADKHFADKWETEPHDFNIIGIIGKNTLVTDKNVTERTYAKGIVSKPVTICIYDGLTKQTARPYLRPMSNMTKEERRELCNIRPCYINSDDIVNGTQCNTFMQASECQDWLNVRHFDYRGLIEKGLALEAPEGMYK